MSTSLPDPEQVEQHILQYAKDVMVVNAHLGTNAGRRALGTASAKRLKEWVESDAENLKEFYKSILPKAQDTLAKYTKTETNEETIRIEKRAVAELKAEIEKAVKAVTEESVVG